MAEAFKPDWFARILFFLGIISIVILFVVLNGIHKDTERPAPVLLPDFYQLPDQIQTAKEAYAEAHGIPEDASLTVEQLEEVLVPFRTKHRTNKDGKFAAPWYPDVLEVPRQVSKRPELVVRTD